MVIRFFGNSSPYIVELVLKEQEIKNCWNDAYTVIFKNRAKYDFILLIFTDRNESVDVDSKMVEILKETQETTLGGNTSDTETGKAPSAQNTNCRDSPKLIEAVTLF